MSSTRWFSIFAAFETTDSRLTLSPERKPACAVPKMRPSAIGFTKLIHCTSLAAHDWICSSSVICWKSYLVSHERASRLPASCHHGSGDLDLGPTLPLSASRKVIENLDRSRFAWLILHSTPSMSAVNLVGVRQKARVAQLTRAWTSRVPC